MLFGERVLAGESEHGQYQSRIGAVSAELEETKQSLQKAKEEAHFMAYSLNSLKQELEHTKRELHHLKTRELAPKQPVAFDPEIEEIKFIENARDVEANTTQKREQGLEYYLEKKRSVKFASPPSLAKIITSKDVGELMHTNSNSSKKKLKRKPLISFMGGLFSKKKGGQEGQSPVGRGPSMGM
ncbi:hypothetical protein RHGRI_030572 [Rhododendron griersonianum]|uniref:WEB family protein n=1 Tax=Rhododendron griersonianum TaxID=479676 RepID=A0AAV6IRQ3_9ERIC|nr:hypothetical protein RHGRI_030572 [Rhododendron griersonianum]